MGIYLNPNNAAAGIGLDPAEAHVGDTRLLERSLHPVQEAGAFRALAAEVNQHLAAAELPDIPASLFLGLPAEDEERR